MVKTITMLNGEVHHEYITWGQISTSFRKVVYKMLSRITIGSSIC